MPLPGQLIVAAVAMVVLLVVIMFAAPMPRVKEQAENQSEKQAENQAKEQANVVFTGVPVYAVSPQAYRHDSTLADIDALEAGGGPAPSSNLMSAVARRAPGVGRPAPARRMYNGDDINM